MPDKFHHFPLLPFELREQIWKLAVRPAVPGVHVFGMYPRPSAGGGLAASFQAFHPLDLFCLAAPRCLPKASAFTPESLAAEPRSWLRNNPSTYLIDSGLWSACKESQRVMEQAFRRPEYHGEAEWGLIKSILDKNDDLNAKPAKDNFGLFAMPGVTSYATREGDVDRFLSVMPGRDLFILQPFDFSSHLNKPNLNISMPFFYPDDLTRPSWSRRHHIALEYDPAWDKAREEEQRYGSEPNIIGYLIPEIADSEQCVSTVWFIDYRIKTNPAGWTDVGKDSELGEDGRRVFWGSGRRYVQVLNGEWPVTHHTSSENDDRYTYHGPWGLINELRDELSKYEDGEIYGGECWSHLDHFIEFGVLACEYL
ncbi:hypothetical protein OQA88_11688 [Cercophora sp. LCS_1]